MDNIPPFAGQPTATDPAITITLSVSGWNTVAEHVRRGICSEVYDVLTLMYLQMEPQLEAIEREKGRRAGVAREFWRGLFEKQER